MDKRAAKIRKMTDEVSKVAVGRFVTLPVQKKPAQKKTAVPYRCGKTRRMDEQTTPVIVDADGTPGTENVFQSQPNENSSAEVNDVSDDVINRSVPPTGFDIGFDDSDTGDNSTLVMNERPTTPGTSPVTPNSEPESEQPGLFNRFKELAKQEAHEVKQGAHDRYTKAGGVSGIARSAIDVAKEGVHHSDADVSSMTSEQKDEIARTFGAHHGKSEAEITIELTQIDTAIAKYKNDITNNQKKVIDLKHALEQATNELRNAEDEKEEAERKYSAALTSKTRVENKNPVNQDELDYWIGKLSEAKTAKSSALAKVDRLKSSKEEIERQISAIGFSINTSERKIRSGEAKKEQLQNEKNQFLTALYRGLANKKKEEVGLYKKFKREMSERGKTMTGMGNMLSAKGVEWNDKLLAKPGSGAADGVSRIVGRNVGYHPSRSVTDVVVGSTNNNRNRALVDSLTTINAGRSVTPLGAPGSVHDGIGRQIQPTVRAGQVQMPQLSAPRLAGRPGQGMGKLTVTMPDVRSFGSPQQPAPQPSQPPVQQPVTAEMPKMGDFGKESITTFRKANNQIRFVFGDRKSNKGKRKHK